MNWSMTKFGTPIGAAPKSAMVTARVRVGRGAVRVAVGLARASARRPATPPLSSERSPLPGLWPGCVDGRGRRRPLASALDGAVGRRRREWPEPPPWSSRRHGWSPPPVGRRRRSGGSGWSWVGGRGRDAGGAGLGGVERAGAVGVGEVLDAVAVVVDEVRALGEDVDVGEVAAVGDVDLDAALADADDAAAAGARGAGDDDQAEDRQARASVEDCVSYPSLPRNRSPQAAYPALVRDEPPPPEAAQTYLLVLLFATGTVFLGQPYTKLTLGTGPRLDPPSAGARHALKPVRPVGGRLENPLVQCAGSAAIHYAEAVTIQIRRRSGFAPAARRRWASLPRRSSRTRSSTRPLSRALGAGERAMGAQRSAMGALNVASALRRRAARAAAAVALGTPRGARGPHRRARRRARRQRPERQQRPAERALDARPPARAAAASAELEQRSLVGVVPGLRVDHAAAATASPRPRRDREQRRRLAVDDRGPGSTQARARARPAARPAGRSRRSRRLAPPAAALGQRRRQRRDRADRPSAPSAALVPSRPSALADDERRARGSGSGSRAAQRADPDRLLETPCAASSASDGGGARARRSRSTARSAPDRRGASPSSPRGRGGGSPSAASSSTACASAIASAGIGDQQRVGGDRCGRAQVAAQERAADYADLKPMNELNRPQSPDAGADAARQRRRRRAANRGRADDAGDRRLGGEHARAGRRPGRRGRAPRAARRATSSPAAARRRESELARRGQEATGEIGRRVEMLERRLAELEGRLIAPRAHRREVEVDPSVRTTLTLKSRLDDE